MPQPEYELIKVANGQGPGRAPREVVDVVDWNLEKKKESRKWLSFFAYVFRPRIQRRFRQDPTEIPSEIRGGCPRAE